MWNLGFHTFFFSGTWGISPNIFVFSYWLYSFSLKFVDVFCETHVASPGNFQIYVPLFLSPKSTHLYWSDAYGHDSIPRVPKKKLLVFSYQSVFYKAISTGDIHFYLMSGYSFQSLGNSMLQHLISRIPLTYIVFLLSYWYLFQVGPDP